MKNSLPGVKSISYIPCKYLPSQLLARHLAGIPIAILTKGTKVYFYGDPSCECEQNYDDAVYSEDVSLQFNSTDNIKAGQFAFLITDVNDTSYIIGYKEAPFPIIERTKSLGAPDDTPCVYEYNVKFKAKKALVECAVV